MKKGLLLYALICVLYTSSAYARVIDTTNPEKVKQIISSRILKARELEWGGFNEDALREINGVIANYPNSSDAYRERSRIYLAMNKNEDAKKDLKKAVKLEKNNAETYRDMATIAEKENDYNKSQLLNQKADQITQNNAEKIYTRANALLAKKNYDDALTQYILAAATDPSLAEAYYGRALCLFYKKDYAGSLKSVQDAEAHGIAPETVAVLKANLQNYVIEPIAHP